MRLNPTRAAADVYLLYARSLPLPPLLNANAPNALGQTRGRAGGRGCLRLRALMGPYVLVVVPNACVVPNALLLISVRGRLMVPHTRGVYSTMQCGWS